MILKKDFKKSILIAVLMLVGMSTYAQNTFTINGQLGKDKQGKIVLQYKYKNKTVIDSATVNNGSFTFKDAIGDPCYAVLFLNRPARIKAEDVAKQDDQAFFLQGTTITVKGDAGLKTATITGGKSQADYTERLLKIKPLQDQANILQAQMSKYKAEMNDTAMVGIQKQMDILRLKTSQIDTLFVKEHPDSFVAFNLWANKHRGTIELELKPEFKHFSSRIQNSNSGKRFINGFELARKLSVGNIAPDFTLKDTLGNPVTLSSLRGKNVMVCFYVSNILAFNTLSFNLGRINRRLHGKDFVLLGVYYDNVNPGSNTVDYWKSVIKDNSMNWMNVADMGGMSHQSGPISPVAKAYGIDLFPLAFLIGKDGKILARNLPLADKDLSLKIEKLIEK